MNPDECHMELFSDSLIFQGWIILNSSTHLLIFIGDAIKII